MYNSPINLDGRQFKPEIEMITGYLSTIKYASGSKILLNMGETPNIMNYNYLIYCIYLRFVNILILHIIAI